MNEEATLEILPSVAQIYVKRRIKILNENGKENANMQIRFYTGTQDVESVSAIRGYTINGDDQIER